MKAESLLLPKAPKRQDSGSAHHDYAGIMDCSTARTLSYIARRR